MRRTQPLSYRCICLSKYLSTTKPFVIPLKKNCYFSFTISHSHSARRAQYQTTVKYKKPIEQEKEYHFVPAQRMVNIIATK